MPTLSAYLDSPGGLRAGSRMAAARSYRPGVPLLELLPYATDLPIYIETARADDVRLLLGADRLRFPYLRIQGYALPDADFEDRRRT